jgi:hypothetical protein
MGENAFEIMGIPCSNPLLGKALGKTLLHYALFLTDLPASSPAARAPRPATPPPRRRAA